MYDMYVYYFTTYGNRFQSLSADALDASFQMFSAAQSAM